MALDEVSFYTVTGEEINITNLVNQMINYYTLKLELGETAISDFNEGSEIRNLLEALAVGIFALLEEETELAGIPFISLSFGEWLDRIGEIPFLNITRSEGSEATGTVTFRLATEQESNVTIPSETIIMDSETGLEFITEGECNIIAGDLEDSVTATCLTIGVNGNVATGKIDTIVEEDIDTNLVSVTNEFPFEYGTDSEDDEAYRERLLEDYRKDGFGSEPYYLNLGKNIEGVHDIIMVDKTGYTKDIIINGDVKPVPDSVVVDVLTVFSDKDNIILNHNFSVSKVQYTTYDLDITLDVVNEVDEEELSDFVQLFFDGGDGYVMSFEGFNINESLEKSNLTSVLELIEKVVQVTSVKSDNVEISTLSPNTNCVLKLGDVTFNQNVVN